MKSPSPLTEPVTPSPSLAVTVVEITDPTAVGEDIEVIHQDAVQLEANPLRARRVVVRLGRSVLLFQSTNLPIRTRTVLRGGLVAYVAFGPRAAGTLNGLPVGPDRVLASTSGVKVEFVVAAGYESVSFLVPPDDVRAHLRLRQREDQSLIPHGVELLQRSPGAGPKLFEWGRRVADAAAKHPEVFDEPQTNSVAQGELFEMLLSSIGSAVEAERAPRDGTQRAHSRIVQIAEDYALKHADEPLYVTHLCKAASVSERTLQNAFKEIMGMTPIAYLTRLRLHQVRRALRAATPHSTTVTAEALKCGFWHLGDFSRAYKDCFGELPSDILRRKQLCAS
ncbi:MAG: helix-turn-helix domain-containing protein [Planctomycetes bacterium]|nr:helix-turn-helix domain-containing protein [Planctomycetota bacterium]